MTPLVGFPGWHAVDANAVKASARDPPFPDSRLVAGGRPISLSCVGRRQASRAGVVRSARVAGRGTAHDVAATPQCTRPFVAHREPGSILGTYGAGIQQSIQRTRANWADWADGSTRPSDQSLLSGLRRTGQTVVKALLIRRFWVRIPGGARSACSRQGQLVLEEVEAQARHGWREQRQPAALAPEHRLPVCAAAEDVPALEPQPAGRDGGGLDLVDGVACGAGGRVDAAGRSTGAGMSVGGRRRGRPARPCTNRRRPSMVVRCTYGCQ